MAHSVARFTEMLEQRQRQIIWGVAAAVLVAAAIAGVWYWRVSVDNGARRLLADAMAVAEAPVVPATPPAAGQTPPPTPAAGSYPTERARLEAALKRFMAVADAYPSSRHGLAARFEAAAALAALGRTKEAEAQYQQVIDGAGKGLYADTARLGLASVQARAGQLDTAIATFKQMADAKDGALPQDGVLMELAKAYDQAGKRADAIKAYQRIVDEFPQSIYTSAARRELDLSKVTGAI